jgi:hypothetical protein
MAGCFQGYQGDSNYRIPLHYKSAGVQGYVIEIITVMKQVMDIIKWVCWRDSSIRRNQFMLKGSYPLITRLAG